MMLRASRSLAARTTPALRAAFATEAVTDVNPWEELRATAVDMPLTLFGLNARFANAAFSQASRHGDAAVVEKELKVRACARANGSQRGDCAERGGEGISGMFTATVRFKRHEMRWQCSHQCAPPSSRPSAPPTTPLAAHTPSHLPTPPLTARLLFCSSTPLSPSLSLLANRTFRRS